MLVPSPFLRDNYKILESFSFFFSSLQSNFNFVFEWKHVEADGHVVFNRLLFTARS